MIDSSSQYLSVTLYLLRLKSAVWIDFVNVLNGQKIRK